MNTPKVKISSVHSASFSQEGLLDQAMEGTKSSLEMLWVTIACGGFIHPGLVAYVGSECWLTMPQLLSQPTRWWCAGPLQHNKEEGCSISCLSLHWEWPQSIEAGLSQKAHQSQCEGVKEGAQLPLLT